MTHARGLLQFNAYHRYTVDEHSIRVVEHLTSLQNDSGVPGEVYRSIKNKATLHLAALLHDLGKGYAAIIARSGPAWRSKPPRGCVCRSTRPKRCGFSS